MVAIYSDSLPITLEDIEGLDFSPLFGAGIVNPLGPTLNMIAMIGDIDSEEPLPIVHLMLNPFTQKAKQIGESIFEEKLFSQRTYNLFYKIPFGVCPTLLYLCKFLSMKENISVYANFLRRYENARTVRDKVIKHYGRPWKRISEDISGFAENITNLSNDSGFSDTDKLTKSESLEFAEILLGREYLKLEIRAFIDAWDYSIEQVYSKCEKDMLPTMDRHKLLSIVREFIVFREIAE